MKRNLQSNQVKVKRGSASFVASIKSMQSRQIVQQCRSCKRMNHFAKVCPANKEKVRVAEEAEGYGYQSEESLLEIEEITAINGSGKQLTTSRLCFTVLITD